MKSIGLRLVLLSALLAGTSATASVSPLKPTGQTIERNLSYLRIHTLPEDLPSAPGPTGGLVLDLRFVSSDPEAAAPLAGWLRNRARPQAPVLVLVNRETSSAVLALLAPARLPAGAVSVGLATPGFTPDITLPVEPAADHTAYEALEHGQSIDELINPRIDKVRHDEAAMARERAAANAGEADEEPALPDLNEKAPPPPPVPPAPPVDQVLQRAVQLYHALLALRKIP